MKSNSTTKSQNLTENSLSPAVVLDGKISIHDFKFACLTMKIEEEWQKITEELLGGETLTRIAEIRKCDEKAFRLAYAMVHSRKLIARLTVENESSFASKVDEAKSAVPDAQEWSLDDYYRAFYMDIEELITGPRPVSPTSAESSDATAVNQSRPHLVIAADICSLNREQTTFKSGYELVVTSAADYYAASEGATALRAGMLRVGAFDAEELRRLADRIEAHGIQPGRSYNLSTEQTDEEVKAEEEDRPLSQDD